MSLSTRSQKFAKEIHRQISDDVKGKPHRSLYRSLAQELPILIHTAGLAQALAFVESRREKEVACAELLRHLGEVVLVPQGEDGLCSYSRSAKLPEYMRLTRDALDALLWYKRFSQSILKDTQTPPTASATQDVRITEDALKTVEEPK